jgi:hypothetical protein
VAQKVVAAQSEWWEVDRGGLWWEQAFGGQNCAVGGQRGEGISKLAVGVV